MTLRSDRSILVVKLDTFTSDRCLKHLKNISLLSLSCGKQLPFNRSNLIKGKAIL